jgi:hypothetical protein
MVFLLGGCANTAPYAQGFVHKNMGGSFTSCSGENSGIRLGVEHRLKKRDYIKVAAEYEHISHIFCSGITEPYMDQAGITITVGGL